MKKSESIKELATALNLAQAEMSGAKKDAVNPAFGKGSKYADLGAVIDAIKQPFCDNGLSYSQFPIYQDGLVGVTTLLMHTSGEWVESELLLPLTKPTPQAGGSAITYARRYALQSIAGIPAEDDDGNEASKPAAKVDGKALLAQYNAAAPEDTNKMWNDFTPAEQNAVLAEQG